MKKARSVIRSFLEREVSTGLHPIKFEDLKPTDFAKYLGTLTNPVTGCLLSQKMYKNKKTSLYNLFKKYKMKATDNFDDELKDLIAGVEKITSKAKQNGMGSLEEEKHELTIDLYRKIDIWLIENGSPSAVFACASLCLSWS